MFAGTALSVRLFVCAGLSLFIIYGPYLYVVVCVLYAYNLTVQFAHHLVKQNDRAQISLILLRYRSNKTLFSRIELSLHCVLSSRVANYKNDIQ